MVGVIPGMSNKYARFPGNPLKWKIPYLKNAISKMGNLSSMHARFLKLFVNPPMDLWAEGSIL